MDDNLEAERPHFSVEVGRALRDVAGGDRASRARDIADAFAAQFPPTLPPPGAEALPGAGRHVRCTAETAGILYVGGQSYARDARARITARAGGMPAGWCLRLTVVDAVVVPCRPTGSRADPTVLRIQRQMSDPAASAALAAPLRGAFPGRPVTSETHSLFVPRGLAFVREASVVIALSPHPGEDGELIRLLAHVAAAALGTIDPTVSAPQVEPRHRGHLRIVQ